MFGHATGGVAKQYCHARIDGVAIRICHAMGYDVIKNVRFRNKVDERLLKYFFKKNYLIQKFLFFLVVVVLYI